MAVAKPNIVGERVNKILMIVYYFHPDLEIGAVRSTKFAKYLPQFGWRAVVVTVKDKYRARISTAPLDFECEVQRTSKWPVLRDVYLKAKARKKKLNREETPEFREDKNESVVYYHPPSVPRWKSFFYAMSWTPDDKIGWLVPGVINALRKIKTEKIDVIYTSGPPWTCHVIGLILKKLTGKKWVVDFRDPWPTLDKLPIISTPFTRRLENYLLIHTLRKADLILAPVPEMHEQMIKKYGDLISSKFKLITNGFDDDDFRGHSKTDRMPNAPVKFLYTGSLFSGRDPAILLTVISEFFKSGVLQPNEISIEFRGGLPEDMPGVDNFIANHGLSSVVQFNPAISRDKYIDLLFDADVLLVMQGADAPAARPAKIYDYLATGNLIMALTPGGATRNFLSNFDNVIFAEPDNKEMIKDCILKAIAKVRSGEGNIKPDTDMLNEYTSRSLTEKLGGLLWEIEDQDGSNIKGKH
jgi:hypothetical protein